MNGGGAPHTMHSTCPIIQRRTLHPHPTPHSPPPPAVRHHPAPRTTAAAASLIPYELQWGGAAMLNISLLASDLWAALARCLLFGERPCPQWFPLPPALDCP